MRPTTRPITLDAVVASSDPLEIRSGPSIVPTERLKIFSPAEWEGFTNEWVSSLNTYGLVERTGGAGDMGCDVIATVAPTDPDSEWDLYQCKHYDHPLAPSDVWIELGKLCYYTFTQAFTLPRRYFFIAPRGVGTKLARLLKKPQELKAALFREWSSKCADKLVEGQTVALNAPLQAHIDAIDFGMFLHVPPLDLIEGHAKTRYFAARFGLGLPARPSAPLPPSEVAASENRALGRLACVDRRTLFYDALFIHHNKMRKTAKADALKFVYRVLANAFAAKAY